jgi:hypothetical protein
MYAHMGQGEGIAEHRSQNFFAEIKKKMFPRLSSSQLMGQGEGIAEHVCVRVYALGAMMHVCPYSGT